MLTMGEKEITKISNGFITIKQKEREHKIW